MSKENGKDPPKPEKQAWDGKTPERAYRIPKNPDAFWYVAKLNNYELALLEAVKHLQLMQDDVCDDENVPSDERMADLSRVAADVGAASYELAYGINPSIDRRRGADRRKTKR